MNIIFENQEMILSISPNCIPVSLICKETGEECLQPDKNLALFSLTEERPYNNEIKLAHPNKRTTFQANRVRLEGDCLIVGFELVTFEAKILVKNAPLYISFELVEFIVKPEDFGEVTMTPPPVAEFRLLQLPIKNRTNFGEWLNVSWDNKAAVNVLGNSRWSKIDSEKRDGYRVMYADALRDVKLKGCSASLIVTPGAKLMDAIEAIEEDYDLPRGVKSRRSNWMNASVYWTTNIHPGNVDQHIAHAKAGGFRLMLIYYCAFFKEEEGYALCGDYDFHEYYPNGMKDVEEMLRKIKASGITPGLHFLQTHIGKYSRYISPIADHRLNLTRHFTLAKGLNEDDSVVYVEQNPEGTVMHEKCRVLQFGGELIHYEAYTTEWPYCFTGCERGHWNTNVTTHALGTIGGILDVSEFGATSIYIDQNTSLQDEVAEKLAAVYNVGFEFIYFDGSEGTNAPFEIHIPNAQYKVYQKTIQKPIFCEGAAKSHFSWHMLSGGNAFDVFPTNIFKEKIAEFPLEEAGRMACDFTRVNFGWWAYRNDMMPDHYEYGTSKAASWDCPATIQLTLEGLEENKRTKDILEVMRRWEDVRAKKWLSLEQKKMLRDPNREFTLLINEAGEYELVEYIRMQLPKEVEEDVTAYMFERQGKPYVVIWDTKGEKSLRISKKNAEKLIYEEELGGKHIDLDQTSGQVILPIAGKRYLSGVTKEEFLVIFKEVEFIE